MKRITHLFKTYFPNTQGGLEEAIRQISKYSVKNGFDVKVISVSKNPFEGKLDGVNCKSYKHNIGPLSSPISFGLLKDFKKIISETDILHLQFPWPTGELMTLLANVKKPVVITFHCDIHSYPLYRKLYTPFLNSLFRKAKYIIPTSVNLLESSSILHNFRSKCVPVNLWLDKERFEILDEPTNEFQTYVDGLKEFSLFVGVLRWYKGLDFLLDSAKKIKGNIVIVGKGPLFLDLKNRIINENINNVYLLGYQDDKNVKYLISKSRFVILPSISAAEAFGQILLEASFFRKPMISTELGTGTSFVNLNNETGFVVKPNDVDSFVKKSNELFMDDFLIEEFGNNSYNRLINNFTEDIQGPRYIDLYNKL
jgi:glycosyltransferase involved in cell wall biosynthesis